MDTIHAIPALYDNYIWAAEGGGRAVVVDPGEAAPVIAFLDRHGLELEGVLITHHHHDHVGGLKELLDGLDIPVYGPAKERVPGVNRPVGDGDTVEITALDARFAVLEVPGHTAGHIAYYGHGVLFSGDTLFAGGCGRLFEGTAGQMHDSLSRLAALPAETRICCGHEYTVRNLEFAHHVEPGNDALYRRLETARRQRRKGESTLPSTLAEELATNPYFRTGVAEVAEAAQRWAGRSLDSEADIFATLRAWKDSQG